MTYRPIGRRYRDQFHEAKVMPIARGDTTIVNATLVGRRRCRWKNAAETESFAALTLAAHRHTRLPQRPAVVPRWVRFPTQRSARRLLCSDPRHRLGRLDLGSAELELRNLAERSELRIGQEIRRRFDVS